MQYYDISVAANGQQDVQAPGSYLYYLNGSAGGADNTIVVKLGMGGTKVLLKPGQSVRLPADAKDIADWVISNYANSATIIGQVLIGRGEFTDSTISGSVQVIDGGKARTLGGGAMLSYVIKPAVAAQYGRVQLWNPVGSGRRLNVESLLVNSGNSVISAYGLISAGVLATLSQAGVSKLSGGAASVASLYTDSNGAAPPQVGALFTASLVAGATLPIKFAEPIVLMPGSGLHLWGTVPNADLGATFEWYEESNI